MTPRALAVSPNSSGYAYIADAASGYIRRIQQGTTLSTTATTAIDPTYGGLYLGTLGDPCPFTTNPAYTGVVNAINAGGDFYGVNVSACPSTNYLSGGNLGTGITSLVLNEVFFNWLWINVAPGRALVFAQEASTHYGFLANAFADEITRLPDPDIQIEPSMPTKVLISNLVSGIPYPSSNQTADAQIRIDITASVGYARVYLRVIDPADTAAYVQPAACGSASGCDCGIAGQWCDNKDASANWGLGAGRAITTYVDTDENGLASIVLYTTARYAGDNYQVQASYQPLSAATPVSNAHIKAQSGIITAWKRVFVERDKMFKKGGLLFADFNKDTCAPNCSQLLLYDWATIADGDNVVVFDEATTAEVAGEVRTVTGVPVPGPPNSGFVTVTLNANLTKKYHATANDGLSPPHPTFANNHSGGLGVLSGDPETINGTGARFYEADMQTMPQAFNDTFVEFLTPRGGEGALPYIDALANLYASSSTGRSLRALFSSVWFQNGPITGNNYLHLIGARGEDGGSIGGDTLPEDKESMICIETWYAKYSLAADAEAAVQTATSHEIAHQFYVNACALTDDCSKQAAANHHDYRPRWMDNTTGCPAANANPCLMDPTGGAQTSGINRFCREDMLLGDPEAPCTFGATTFGRLDTAVRTVLDPLPMWGVPGGP